MNRFVGTLKTQWFLCAVAIVLTIGIVRPFWAVAAADTCAQIFPSSVLTACVLFCMSITLPLQKFHDSLKRPAGLLLACSISIVLMPLAAWGLSLLQLTADAQWGLFIAGAVPSTMASAAVWTRRAGGNDAIALCVTLITNGFCFLVIPFWMGLYSGADLGFDPFSMIVKLLVVAVWPMCLGQMLRLIPAVAFLVNRRKMQISLLAQVGILVIIFQGLIRIGNQQSIVSEGESTFGLSMIWLGLSCLLLHAVGLLAGLACSRVLKLHPADQIAVGISGSQKTLAIALETAAFPQIVAIAAGGLLMLGPLMFHILQLIFDSIVVEVWNRSQNSS